MSETLLPMIEDEWKKFPLNTTAAPSLMTNVGLVEGDVLAYLEQHGGTSLRQLVRELGWPAPMVTMAVGALIRQGLVRGLDQNGTVLVSPMVDSPAEEG